MSFSGIFYEKNQVSNFLPPLVTIELSPKKKKKKVFIVKSDDSKKNIRFSAKFLISSSYQSPTQKI